MVAPLVEIFLHHPRHRLWPDAVSLLDPLRVQSSRLLEAGQRTDAYRLALAGHHAGRPVTLDRRLGCEAVIGGREALRLIEA